METVTDFTFGGSKITADGECSHEIKRHVLLGRKAMTNLKWSEVAQSCLTLCGPMDCSLPGSSVHGVFQARVLEWVAISFSSLDSILKSRHITLSTKVHLVKNMVFPAVKYGCESWTIKKAEHQRIDAFELWCWKRLLRVPWTARRSNQSILKEISPEYSLEGLMLNLKLLILWPPDAKSWLTWKDPDAGKDWRWEEKGTTEDEMVGWHHWLNGHKFEQALGVGDGQGRVMCCSLWGHTELDTTEQLNWTEMPLHLPYYYSLKIITYMARS